MKNDKKDDRLISWTRIAFGILAVLTVIFGPLMYLYPGGTAQFWAWEIQPEMSAVWVGAGYTFGAMAIWTLLLIGRFPKLLVAVLATWPFSCVMLIATLVHLDRFFVDSAGFWVWFAIYLGLPFGLPIAWWLNKNYAIPPQPDELRFSKNITYIASSASIVLLILAAVLIFNPSFSASFWPWNLTPLMSRVIGGWILFLAVAPLSLFFERRYIAYREFIPEAGIWFTLLLIGGWRYSDQFNFSRSAAYIFFGVLILLTGLMFYLFFSLEKQYHKVNTIPDLVEGAQSRS
jgi:hypothetical protein